MTTPTNERFAAPATEGGAEQGKFFGHPRQLGTLFHIELWERFSFYGMQAILLIYLYYEVSKGGLGMDETKAAGIVGAYNGSIYLATILSGWLSDRILGAEKTLFLSGVVVMLGHIVLSAFPNMSGLVIGLLLIALGSGGVKSSAGAIVGSWYETESTRDLRDAGFSVFYTAINIGGFVGPLIVGILQVQFGFHYGFGAAAVGMAFGLWQYWRGRVSLPHTPPSNPLPKQKYGVALGVAVAGLAVIGGCIATGLLRLDNFSQVLLGTVILTSLLYFVRLFCDSQVTKTEKQHMLAYVPLFIVMCLFWAVWSQVFTVVTVYFDQTSHRVVGGFEIPVAMIILGVSYLCFIPFLSTGKVMPLIIMALLLLTITISELLLSPISLSFATKIAPQSFKTQMVSFNFLTLSLGFTLGGVLVDECYVPEKAVEFYVLLGALGIGGGVLLMVMMPMLNRMLRDVD